MSLSLYQFVLLRWYFRLFIWTRFLWQVSRIDLRLIPTHPDRCGGLGFVAAVGNAFVPILPAQGGLARLALPLGKRSSLHVAGRDTRIDGDINSQALAALAEATCRGSTVAYTFALPTYAQSVVQEDGAVSRREIENSTRRRVSLRCTVIDDVAECRPALDAHIPKNHATARWLIGRRRHSGNNLAVIAAPDRPAIRCGEDELALIERPVRVEAMGLLAKKLSEESRKPCATEDRRRTGAAVGMQRVAGQHDPARQLGQTAPLPSPGAVFRFIVSIGRGDKDGAGRHCDEGHTKSVHTSSVMQHLAQAALVQRRSDFLCRRVDGNTFPTDHY